MPDSGIDLKGMGKITMVPKTPTRRGKPDQEPLTIDAVATSSEVTGEPLVSASETSGTADDSPASTDAPVETPTEPVIEPTQETSDTSASSEARPTEAADTPPYTPSYTAPPPPPRGTSTTGALAAGILGGLVALLGAGGLQYAGFLPSLSASAGPAVQDEALAGEIEALKARIDGLPVASAAPDTSALEGRIAALEQAGTSAASGAAEAKTLAADIANLTSELATLKSGLADASKATEETRSELSTRIDAAEDKLNEPASDIQMARAIAVTALKTSIDRGGPFLAELDALKSVSPEDPAVAGLAADASVGIEPRADLVRAFPETADLMLDAVRQTSPDQGIFNRLVNSAASAIRVRPVGEVEGDGPEAIIARVETKLVNGDLKGAVLEWDGLPDAAKTAGSGFREALDRRIRAEDLIDAAVSGALTPTPAAPQGATP